MVWSIYLESLILGPQICKVSIYLFSKVASIAMLYTLDLLQNANILFTPI